MGFDMSIVEEVPGLATAIEGPKRAFESACAERGRHPRNSAEHRVSQAAVDLAYAALLAAELDYFHLNITGMSRCERLMLTAGMAHERGAEQWPERAAYGLAPDDLWWDDDEGDTPPPSAAHAKYAAAVGAHLGRVGDEPGIPLFKFGSNDGWWVRPAECRSAVLLWQQFDAAQPDQAAEIRAEAAWWDRWIAFLARAALHGGFRVH